MNKDLKDKILNLRIEGKSYREISDELGCAKSVVSFHCSKLKNNVDLIKELTDRAKEERKELAKPDLTRKCRCCKSEIPEDSSRLMYCSDSCYKQFHHKVDCSCGGTKRANSKVCSKCRTANGIENAIEKTLDEFQGALSVQGKHPSWKNAQIRNYCRSWNKELLKSPCMKCGYSLHVELCHIKAVSDFPPEATLGEVNNIDNLLALCPNCHWEFDRGLWKINDLTP